MNFKRQYETKTIAHEISGYTCIKITYEYICYFCDRSFLNQFFNPLRGNNIAM